MNRHEFLATWVGVVATTWGAIKLPGCETIHLTFNYTRTAFRYTIRPGVRRYIYPNPKIEYDCVDGSPFVRLITWEV